jgi:FMN reductase
MFGLVVNGAASPSGRFRRAIEAMASAMEAQPGFQDSAILDLAVRPLQLCDGRPPGEYDEMTTTALSEVSRADAVVLGSPVYRASYTGTLKNLLDLLPLSALEGKTVGIMAMGASPHHYLGVDNQLRAVLSWFGALVVPTSVYLTGASFDDEQKPMAGALDELDGMAAAVGGLADAAWPRQALRPLAAGRG